MHAYKIKDNNDKFSPAIQYRPTYTFSSLRDTFFQISYSRKWAMQAKIRVPRLTMETENGKLTTQHVGLYKTAASFQRLN